ncbi:MAG: hypothetical protein ABSB28_10320 [Candidatus Bathyarchaeia archaeon]
MPFIFYCSQCGSLLYEDSKPLLQDGTYRRQTYLQSVVLKIGGKCPNCGRKLHIPPSKVEVLAPQLSTAVERKGKVLLSE